MIAEEQLAEWEALAAAATPGPWRAAGEKDDDDRREFYLMFGQGPGVAGEGTQAWSNALVSGMVRWEEDRYGRIWSNVCFAAAAREAVPALIAEVRRLRAIKNGALESWAEENEW